MKIIDTFLKLTGETYPHGTETQLLRYLPKNIKLDQFGNYFLEIGKTTTMFTSHLDTASYDKSVVRHVIKGDLILTDGSTILGADDKAGVTIMLYMIKNKVPGLYYFFLGEERGCIGSSKLKNVFKNIYPQITKVISFDRRGKGSIITHQSYGRTASDEFAIDLSNKLNSLGFGFNYQPDPTGIYTDSNQFAGIVSECTNISVGYQSEHTRSENQSISHLENLCKAAIKIDWESLVVSRDFTKNDDPWSRWDNGYWGVSTDYSQRDSWDYGGGTSSGKTQSYYDGLDWDSDDFEDEDDTNHDQEGEDQLITIQDIEDVLDRMGVDYDSITWDGDECYILKDGVDHYFANRETLEGFIDFYLWDSNLE